MNSPSFDAVLAAEHPEPEQGGPCATCAFRRGTKASRNEYTVAIAVACVEGIVPFHCHEKPQLCRGWIAAANLREVPVTDEDRRHMEAARWVLFDAVARAKAATEAKDTA